MGYKKPQQQISKEQYDMTIAQAQLAHDRRTQSLREQNDMLVNSANMVLRTLLLINGAAAIALLAFIGSLLSGEGSVYIPKIAQIASPIISFAWGAVLSFLAMSGANFSIYGYATSLKKEVHIWDHPYVEQTRASKRWTRFGNIFQGLTILVAIASLGFFIKGMYEIYDAIINLN